MPCIISGSRMIAGTTSSLYLDKARPTVSPDILFVTHVN